MSVTAQRLRARMDEIGVSQEELAAAVGCTQGAISLILRGQTLNSKFLPRIADHLGVSLAWLIGTSDEMRPPEAGKLLSPEERELIELSGRMSIADRKALLQVARSMAALPAFAKDRDRQEAPPARKRRASGG